MYVSMWYLTSSVVPITISLVSCLTLALLMRQKRNRIGSRATAAHMVTRIVSGTIDVPFNAHRMKRGDMLLNTNKRRPMANPSGLLARLFMAQYLL